MQVKAGQEPSDWPEISHDYLRRILVPVGVDGLSISGLSLGRNPDEALGRLAVLFDEAMDGGLEVDDVAAGAAGQVLVLCLPTTELYCPLMSPLVAS